MGSGRFIRDSLGGGGVFRFCVAEAHEKPSSLRTLLVGRYNDSYQTFYDLKNAFRQTEMLVASQTPLETDFVLWNTARGRTPFDRSLIYLLRWTST